MTTLQQRHEKNRAAVKAWTWPEGTPVLVTRANGETLETVTETRAFLLYGKYALIGVRGIPGNTRLDRVRVLQKRGAGRRKR